MIDQLAERSSSKVLQDLRALCMGEETTLGTVTATLEDVIDIQHQARGQLTIVRDRESRRARAARPYEADLIHLVAGHEPLRPTRKLIARSKRRGEDTCLAVSESLPIATTLHQLHLGHRFVLIPWDTSLSRFTTGLIKNAHQNGSCVIATGIHDIDQVREAVELGVQVGAVNRTEMASSTNPRIEKDQVWIGKHRYRVDGERTRGLRPRIGA